MNVARARSHSRDKAGDRSAELDEVTLRRAQRGDDSACRQLVERYQRPVFALLYRMLGAKRADRVEDLAQDTFLAVFRQLGGFATLGPARLSTWILTIATRRALDELRKRTSETDQAMPGDLVAAERADDRARGVEIADRVARAVMALPPEHRAVFLLRQYHDLEYADIARALDIDIGTVKSRLSRGRGALRAALADQENPDE